MASLFTKLVNFKSGALEPSAVDQLPPYVAVSHTWADRLFAPGLPFEETAGWKVIDCLLRMSEFEHISYVWIDTLSIDQDDPTDKHRQIPLMGDIYRGAEVVAIVTREHFGFTQAWLDQIMAGVQGAVEMSMEGSFQENGDPWVRSNKFRRRLKKAMDCLNVFTRPQWGSRVWTLQEFILAKKTVWIGRDLQPLKINERLFQALPDVCDSLSIEECLTAEYSKLYSHFQGMAGAHLKLTDRTRCVELLGNRSATVPEDEVYGLMAASGVVLDETNVSGKEKVWALWWEKAVQTGHLRWALLPPATPAAERPAGVARNCIMPDFSVRHLASTNSVLDHVEGYGPVRVEAGTVSMVGRLVCHCTITRKLGRICLDQDGVVVRDVTLCLFAANNWQQAMQIAAAFGAGRYSLKKRMMIAQVLVFNYYRARLAVLEQRTKSFRPRFRTKLQAFVWSDFMQLQSIHMRVMNDGEAFLARIWNDLKSTEAVVVTAGQKPLGNLWALDFGAVNESEKTMFTIVRAQAGVEASGLSVSCTSPSSPSLHKEGVAMYMQVTESLDEAVKYASPVLEAPQKFERFKVGGDSCPVCATSQSHSNVEIASKAMPHHERPVAEGERSPNVRNSMRLQMRRQNRALKMRWKKRVKRVYDAQAHGLQIFRLEKRSSSLTT